MEWCLVAFLSCALHVLLSITECLFRLNVGDVFSRVERRSDFITVSSLIHQWQFILFFYIYILSFLLQAWWWWVINGVCVCVVHVNTEGRKTNHPASALRKMSMSFWDLWSMEGCSVRTMSSQLHLHIQLAPLLSRLALIKLLFLFHRYRRATCESDWSDPYTGLTGFWNFSVVLRSIVSVFVR